MPYTDAQCALFAIKAAKGLPVPADWREECRKNEREAEKEKAEKDGSPTRRD